jgi:hypothetical protein
MTPRPEPHANMAETVPYSGIPRTVMEWAALKKLASGDTNVSKEDLRRLFMLGLVERQLGHVCLTKHGREMLALHERAPPDEADRGVASDDQLPLFRDAER